MPEKFSGIVTIPEKNQKNFRYSLDTGKEFWYYYNTRRKSKKLPVLKEGVFYGRKIRNVTNKKRY